MRKVFKATLALVVLITVSAFTTKSNITDSGYKIGDVATDFELENIVFAFSYVSKAYAKCLAMEGFSAMFNIVHINNYNLIIFR